MDGFFIHGQKLGKRSVNALVRIISSFFYVGYAPFWSGAWGSFAAFGLIVPFADKLAWVTALLTLVGFLVAGPAQKVLASDDPKEFVLDEVCGMCVSLLFIPLTPANAAAGYALFRFFDVVKPWPIRLIQQSRSPASIMLDDLAAGLAANLILQAALRIFH